MNEKNKVDYSTREARIRLTPKCNYRCFFCHEEGGCQAPVADWKSTRGLLLALKAQGRKEITFTGGEPLLNKPVLLKCLREIASWQVQPLVTLITNASLLDEEVIVALEKCQHAKVHVSIHDPYTAGYQMVTGQRRRTALELVPILKRLSSGPVKLKLNAALTSDYAESEDALERMLCYAVEVGASSVKFVELLETKDASAWPMRGTTVERFGALLAKRGYERVRKTLRTDYWRVEEGLETEVTRCACALGCEHCEATRGDSFTGGTHYHPCFMDAETISMVGRPLEDVLAEGEAYLRRRIGRTVNMRKAA